MRRKRGSANLLGAVIVALVGLSVSLFGLFSLIIRGLGSLVRTWNRSRPLVDSLPPYDEEATARVPARLLGAPRPQSPSARNPSPSVRAIAGPARWIPPDQTVEVAGLQLPGGLLYVGTGLRTVSGGTDEEPSLINPTLPVDSRRPDRLGAEMGYWPSYSRISAQCRGAYLEWLAGGRRDPDANIGYVFLFFYGLERRVLFDLSEKQSSAELVPIRAEIERLIAIYPSSQSFQSYAIRLIEVLRIWGVAGTGEDEWPRRPHGGEVPISVRVAIAQAAVARQPIAAPLALSWALSHPDSANRTVSNRCAPEIAALFNLRYTAQFGEGHLVSPMKRQLRVELRTASASIGKVSMAFPDLSEVATSVPAVRPLQNLAESCMADLEAYSRWLGRNPNGRGTLAAAAVLPADLVAAQPTGEVAGLRRWAQQQMGDAQRVTVDAGALLTAAQIGTFGMTARAESLSIAQLFGVLGLGIEPDVRFGGAACAAETVVVLFLQSPSAPTVPSQEYMAAQLLAQLAGVVSWADGHVAPEEAALLRLRGRDLAPAERARFEAHIDSLIASRPSLTALKKRVGEVPLAGRKSLAQFWSRWPRLTAK